MLKEYIRRFSKYKTGDILYMRETWQDGTCLEDENPWVQVIEFETI